MSKVNKLTDGSTGPGPDWRRLNPELNTQIFQKLGLRDRIRAELCCRAWYTLLSSGQVTFFTLLKVLQKRHRQPAICCCGSCLDDQMLPDCARIRQRVAVLASHLQIAGCTAQCAKALPLQHPYPWGTISLALDLLPRYISREPGQATSITRFWPLCR